MLSLKILENCSYIGLKSIAEFLVEKI